MKRLILLVFIFAVASCNKSNTDSQKPGTGNTQKSGARKDFSGQKMPGKFPAADSSINVEAKKIYLGDAVSIFNTTTILEADHESGVTSKASGIVLQINVEVGDKVESGDVLAVLESDVQQLQFESAEANYQKSLHNYERAKTLLTKGLANQESVDNLKFETRSLKTKMDEALLDLEFTRVKAPISGVITKRNIKKGNLIPLNTEVYHIVDFDSIQALVNIPENKWESIRENLEVRLRFAGIEGLVTGKISRVDPVVDSTTGTFGVIVEINPQDKAQLRPGLFGKTEIVLDKHSDAILVSKDAVIREDKKAYVYTINDDSTVTKTFIEIGYEMTDSIEVLSGLQVGQSVVTTGKNNISEDSKVEVVEYND